MRTPNKTVVIEHEDWSAENVSRSCVVITPIQKYAQELIEGNHPQREEALRSELPVDEQANINHLVKHRNVEKPPGKLENEQDKKTEATENYKGNNNEKDEPERESFTIHKIVSHRVN